LGVTANNFKNVILVQGQTFLFFKLMHIVRCKFSGHFFSSDPKANPVGAMGGAGIGMHKKLVKVYYIFRI
jgi:hypothetical protein